MNIELTKKQLTDLMSMLFVGSIDFKDKKNKAICEELHDTLKFQFLKEVGEND